MGLLDFFRGAPGDATAADVPAPASPRQRVGSAFLRGGRSLTLGNWKPALRFQQQDIAEVWDEAAAKAMDAIHNSGWLTGAVEQAVANTVGTGLRLKPSPEQSVLGMSPEQAKEWTKLVERRWELWSRNALECDIRGRETFGQMQAGVFQQWLGTGEVLAEIAFKKAPYNVNGTKIRTLSPTRLSRRSDDLSRLVNGVYVDADGMAVGYAIMRKDRVLGTSQERRVPARDMYGRPRLIHVFSGMPETYRGISPLAPVLQTVRQYDQLADATLMAAIVQSLFAATITSDEPTEEVLEGLLTDRERAEMLNQGISPFEAYTEMVAGFYENADIDVGINGRLAHLFPGQKLEFQTAQHPNSNYPEFVKMLLREIARALGMTYEGITGDYTGATYASLNRALAEVFEITKLRRTHVVEPFCQAAYEAWLEEEIERGDIPFPGGIEGFLTNRPAACRALWLGGPKPIAEEGKLAKAHETWFRLGAISEQMMCADLGVDYEDVIAQRAEAKAIREEYGVEDPLVMAAHGGAPVDVDGNEEDDDDDEEGRDDAANRRE